MIKNLPRQKVPLSRKTKAWREECVKALIEAGDINNTGIEKEILRLYSAYNGKIDTNDYAHFTNPFNSDDDNFKRYPAKIRNYNILKPIIDLLIGEHLQRPVQYRVINNSSEDFSAMNEYMKMQIVDSLQRMFVNELNKSGFPTGQETQPEVDTPEHIIEASASAFAEMQSESLERILEFLQMELELQGKIKRVALDALVAGFTVTYKTHHRDEIIYQVKNPANITFGGPSDIEFIEDADWVRCKERMTLNQIVDEFYDILPKDIISKIEAEEFDPGMEIDIFGKLFVPGSDVHPQSGATELYDVYHVVWKTLSRVGELTYLDEFGRIQTDVVPDGYEKGPMDINLEWYWVNEVWEGYRIGESAYFGIGPVNIQRDRIDNISRKKLPYNGFVLWERNNPTIMSPVSVGLPYQILYNIIHYSIELTIAKNKGKIALFDINTIPKLPGWNAEKFFYTASAAGFALIDSTASGINNKQVSFNQYQVLDMELGGYLDKQFKLLQLIKEEWEDVVGVPRQRQGNVLASDTMGGNERAIFQSSMVTRGIFDKIDRFVGREYEGFIDVVREAWRGGKRAFYITSDGERAVLEAFPEAFAASQIGVFVRNSDEEKQKLESFRNLALGFAQNGYPASVIAEILDSNNFSSIKRALKDAEQAAQKQAQQQQEAGMESAERMKQAEIEAREDIQAHQKELKLAELEVQKYKIDKDVEMQMEKLKVDQELAEIERKRLLIEKDRVDVEREKVKKMGVKSES